MDGAVTLHASGTVDPAVLGSYTRTYAATDSHGNTNSVTRTVNVVDTQSPSLVLLGDNPQTMALNGTYTESGASATDAHEGSLTVTITGTVDTTTAATYTKNYAATDSSGNTASITRSV